MARVEMSSIDDFTVELDRLDYAILSRLQEDGRKSFSDIAKELDIAVNTVRYRISKLVESETLHFYAFVNPLHLDFDAISEIQIKVSPPRLVEQAASVISELTEVSFVVMVMGEFDLLVEVNCQDNNHLVDLLGRIAEVDGVVDTRTCTYLKVFKWHQPDLGKIREQRAQDIAAKTADNGHGNSNIRSR